MDINNESILNEEDYILNLGVNIRRKCLDGNVKTKKENKK
jgi:hypothetical protein